MPIVKIQRLFHVLPWLLVIFLTLLFIALLVHELNRLERDWEQQLIQGEATQKRLVEASRDNRTYDAKLIAQLIVEDRSIAAVVRAAYQARQAGIDHPEAAAAIEVQLQQLRARLVDPLTVYWDKLKAGNGRQLTIYFAEGAEAFYRAHHPERYGDLSINVRPMVMQVLRSGKSHSGLDVGRHGAGYRAVIPIFAQDDNSRVIAAVELGLGLLDASLLSGGGEAVLVNPLIIKELVWPRVQQDLTSHRSVFRDQWLLEEYSDELAKDWLLAGVLPDPLTERYRQLNWDGREYLFYVTPLQDYLGEADAQRIPRVAIITWEDVTEEFASYRSTCWDAVTKWLLALFIADAALLLLLRLTSNYARSLIDEHHQRLERERDSSEAAREHLTLALESGESGFWDWNIKTDHASFSPQWKKICGVDPQKKCLADADEWHSRIHPNDKTIFQRDMLRHLQGHTPMYESEYRLRAEDGKYHWIYSRGKVIEWHEGRAARIVGVYTDVTARKQAEVTILRQQAALRAMNEIASLPAIEPEEQLRRGLSLGASYLGLPVGIISHITQNDYIVRVQVSPPGTLADKDFFALGDTYCQLTINQGDVVAVDHMAVSEYCGHPCYERFRLESYIGTPLLVSGKVYGTLSFSSAAQRYHPFDDLDKDFIRLLGRWTGVTIERWEQLSAQQELLQRFRKLSERLPGFLYQYQLHTDGSAFFPYVSAGIETMFGVRAEQALLNAAAVFKQIHPDDQATLQKSIRQSAAELSVWFSVFRVSHARGQLWVRGEAKPELMADGSVLWHGFFSDITHEKAAELELQANSALQQAIFDAASLAIIAVEKSGTIQIFNRGAEAMLGYNAVELVGQATPEIFHLKEEIILRAEELSRELMSAVKPGFEVFVASLALARVEEREWTYVHKDGSHIPVLLTVSALRDADDEIQGYVGIARDITELKRIERMKSEFIATVSHELRTPLTAITGSLGLVVNGVAGSMPDNMKKMLDIAYKNSERLILLVNDLLDMEKLVAGKVHFETQAVLLRPLVEQAIESMTAYAEQYRVSYEVLAPAEDVWVCVDTRRLTQVLANYLSNAAKFSGSDTVVKVSIAVREASVRVSIRDQGIGIPKDFHAHIFEKFSQVDSSDSRQKGGTGLGLAICKELIERMGGSLGFESVLGEGSTFYFDLPYFDMDKDEL